MARVTLRYLLESIGEAMVTPLATPGGLDVPVTDLVIYDSAAAPVIEPGDVILAVGLALDDRYGADLLRLAEDSRAAAVAFRSAPSGAVPSSSGPGTGVAILQLNPELEWGQFFTLTRGLILSAPDIPEDAPELAGGDLFALANAVADMVGGSVVLYDARHQVMAYSNLDDDVDEVRRDTILGRRTPPAWILRFERDGVYSAGRPDAGVTRLEGYEGLRTRLRVAVRAGEDLVGEISVAEASTPFPEGAEAALQQAARLAAPHFLRHQLAHDLTRSVRGGVLRSLLDGRGRVETHARHLDLSLDMRYTVIGFSVRPDDGRAPDVVGHRERFVHLTGALTETFHRRSATYALGSTVYALLPTAEETGRDRLRRLTEHVAARAEAMSLVVLGAVGRTVPTLTEVTRSRRDVDQVLCVLGAGDRDRSVSLVESVWADIALLDLRDLFEQQRLAPSEQVAVLTAHDASHQTQYVRTLRVYLDCFGDVRTAAARLQLHPNSLRHRLQRARELFGVDLDDPAARLVLALELHTML
ncbi:CdaR family transcriptional regulator [Modestobacter sp. DSM 44400]|uniref:PucR family transcriptional regulator n=1 Tax=Modestobacter sp. DSM 44400 TaxID=1550230 RepID=UPI0015872A73|nr:helix-turn-helix domain-containing protein [Modestobacter sp. DSM 44400]